MEFELVKKEEVKEHFWCLDHIDHIPLAHGTSNEDKDWCQDCDCASDIIVKGYGYCDHHFAKNFCQLPEPSNGITYFNL